MPASTAAQESLRHSGIKRMLHLTQKIATTQNLFYVTAFFFISMSTWFQMQTSFCICCALALTLCGKKPYTALIGTTLGHVYLTLWHVQVSWWTPIVILSLTLLQGCEWKGAAKPGIVCMLMHIPGYVIYGMAWQYTKQEWVLQALLILFSGLIMPALIKAANLLKTMNTQDIKSDDVLCLLLPLLLLLSGMSKISLFSINFGYMCAVTFICFSSRVLSLSASMSLGFLCGTAFLFSGHGAYWLVSLPLIGVFHAMLQGKRRWLCAATSPVICILASYVLFGKAQILPAICAAAGGILWLMLPVRYHRYFINMLQHTGFITRTDNPYLERKMLKLAEYMKELSKAVPVPIIEKASNEQIAETLMENLCENCDRMLICWHDQYESRKTQFVSAAAEILNNGEAELPVYDCVRIPQWHTETDQILANVYERDRRVNQVIYEQEMMNTHFAAFSDILRKEIQNGFRPIDEELYQERQLSELLSYLRFPAKVLYVKTENGHFSTALQVDPLRKTPVTIQQLEKHIGRRLGNPMQLTSHNDYIWIFDETPPYDLLRGVASACAVSAERKNITPYTAINGDAVIAHTIQNGLEMTGLSDGMGHGDGAGYESRKTLELLSLCLTAGYTHEQAITAVNGMMLLATGGERFATVDMCMMDLWTGKTSIQKLGANLSLVIQGQNIHAIEGEALPLGIIEYIKATEYSTFLGTGDMVLLFSDGITDAFEDEQALSTLIHRYSHLQPQEIADCMLQDALIQSGGLPKDDMTVVCIKLISRKKKVAN